MKQGKTHQITHNLTKTGENAFSGSGIEVTKSTEPDHDRKNHQADQRHRPARPRE